MKRRELLQGVAIATLMGLGGCASLTNARDSKAKVLVVGGGFGGATAARYVRLLSSNQIDVTLIEPEAAFISCPMSNLVLRGAKTMEDITMPYDTLTSAHGVRVVRDRVTAIDTAKKTVALQSGGTLQFDRLVLSPGIDLMLDSVDGLRAAQEACEVLQAWKAGAETVALRQQLEAMPDGGVFVITVPEMPYRCPPAPYERASLVAEYFKTAKPRSKVLILDGNKDVVAKGALFKKVWLEEYPGLVEHRPLQKVVAVDGRTRSVHLADGSTVRAGVLNVVPSMRAGQLALQSGLATAGNRWCPVDYLTFESKVAKDVHVLGDSVLSPPGLPKSGHIANNQAKLAAAAIVAELNGWSAAVSAGFRMRSRTHHQAASSGWFRQAARRRWRPPATTGAGCLRPGTMRRSRTHVGRWDSSNAAAPRLGAAPGSALRRQRPAASMKTSRDGPGLEVVVVDGHPPTAQVVRQRRPVLRQ